MKLIKNILGRLFATYMLLAFVVTITIVAFLVWITSLLVRDEYKRTRAVLIIYRGWMAVYLPLIFCPVSVKGRRNFKKGQQYVVVCNHNSFVDILVATPTVPGAHKTLAKKELAAIPVFGVVYSAGAVLVNRKDPQSRLKSYKEMKRILQQGMHFVLYPEGTRNQTREPLKPFYDGAFRLAVETQTPVMPALLFNTRKILPPGKKYYAWPHRVRMHFLEPVPTQGLGTADIPALKDKVFQLMRAYYVAQES
jgi:1-acyl-sn-glycerol-3-phosphate acyltransferase